MANNLYDQYGHQSQYGNYDAGYGYYNDNGQGLYDDQYNDQSPVSGNDGKQGIVDSNTKTSNAPATENARPGKSIVTDMMSDRNYQEVDYLKKNLGTILVAALAEVCIRRPSDPIDYLGHWLLRWRYNEELKRRDIQNALEVVRVKTSEPKTQPELPPNPYEVGAMGVKEVIGGVLPNHPYGPPGYGGPLTRQDVDLSNAQYNAAAEADAMAMLEAQKSAPHVTIAEGDSQSQPPAADVEKEEEMEEEFQEQALTAIEAVGEEVEAEGVPIEAEGEADEENTENEPDQV